MYTDQQERFLASEIIREKLFMYLDKEVPFGVAVGIEKFKEMAKNSVSKDKVKNKQKEQSL